MQRAHEVELKNTRTLAKNYAVEYFKTKAQQLAEIFTNETYQIVEKYEELKSLVAVKDKRISQLQLVATRQERTIAELRTFIKTQISKIYKKLTTSSDQVMNELHKKVDLITSDPDLKLQYFENLTLFDLYEVYKEPVES